MSPISITHCTEPQFESANHGYAWSKKQTLHTPAEVWELHHAGLVLIASGNEALIDASSFMAEWTRRLRVVELLASLETQDQLGHGVTMELA